MFRASLSSRGLAELGEGDTDELRFQEIEEGSIRIDGQDIRELTQDSLRRAGGVVSQDTSLLRCSFAENMAYGSPGVAQAEIEAAARRARMRTNSSSARRTGKCGFMSVGEQSQGAFCR
ncbi:MAG: hypothetical protein H0X43_02990 [Nitrosospira sp.]|nr:hypothetical protein [Nitrosospira sp.]